jgi:serine/threonine protein kinase
MSSLPPRDPHALVPGARIGPWRILERYDSGSFGAVYRVERAEHPEAGPFALKIALHSEDPRFQREVELLQRTVHPSIPRFEDRGWWTGPDGRRFPFVVMEWVEGRSLYEWARKQQPTSGQLLQVLAQLASALAAVHAAGGVHRDVKGGNILVTAQGRAVLLDWGCGTYEGAQEITDSALPPGTSSYRAPEALRWAWAHRKTGEPYQAGPADDVWALGATAYRLCTGSYPPAPDEGSGPQRRLVPPRELATVSVGLERLLLACLSENRRARPPAAALTMSLSTAASEKDAVKPIVPTPAAADTNRTSHPGPRPQFSVPDWLSAGAVVVVVGGLLMLAAWGLLRHGPNAPAAPECSPGIAERLVERPAPEAPDGGVGEEALASVEQTPRPGSPSYMLGLPMPKEPLPGQKKAPCALEYEMTALGACWLVLEKKPPCGNAGHELAGKCVRPSYNAPREPTSEDPR